VTEDKLRGCLAEYLGLLQRHPSAEEMMSAILTDDFKTGFVGGFTWKGIDGLRDFLSQRKGFFDESHQVKDVLEAPSPTSDEFTGSCYHSWRLRRAPDRWRVAAQMVERFADLNDNAQRLFATPDEGLNR
jgi:hypothetical protein